MPAPLGNDDDTVEIRRDAAREIRRGAAPVRRRALGGWVAGAAVLVAAGGFGAAWLLRAPQVAPTDTETEAQIDLTEPCAAQVSYLAPDSDVLVIDFPSLLAQGLTLDRLAAFVEKANVPHNRVLDDAGLAAALKASGDTVGSYYYGHDYRARDIARFFAFAKAEGIALNPHELWLKRLMRGQGWLAPGANGAIITLSAADGPVAPDMRSVILRHEISHGAFFTVPEYRHYAESFWASLTDSDRAAFRGFLGEQGYDTNLTELMLNETQAYLVFTRDPRFFNAAAIGKTEAEVDQLRQGFIDNMPDFWLRPLADAKLPAVSQTMPSCPVRSAMLMGHGRICLCYQAAGFSCDEG
jgi:hypothetical protein